MPLRVLIVLGMLAGLLLGHRGSPRTLLVCAVAGWSAVTAMFLVAHAVAERAVTRFVAANDPATVTLDRILTPLPANPLCWEVILVQLHDDQYSLRRATLALVPQWLTAADCPNRDLDTQASAPLHAVRVADTDQWVWFGEWRAPRAELAGLVATRCEAAAFVRFARAPWWSSVGATVWLGDLRYDREPQASFAEIELHDACPRHVPPWQPPREDLLPHAAD
jgi:inner membrane protein